MQQLLMFTQNILSSRKKALPPEESTFQIHTIYELYFILAT